MFPFLLFIVGAIVVALFVYFEYQRQKRRREALAALAREMGWQFSAAKDHDHDDEFAHFEIFRRGHSRYAYNTLSGSVEVDGHDYPVKMGDFRYQVTTSNGKTTSTTTYRFSYAILGLPFANVPELLIRPEGMFDQLKGMLGFDDIDFESAEFSRRFFVKSSDKRFAYDVIDPRMMEFLLESNPPTVDIEHARICLCDGSRQWTADEFKSQLRWVREFFDHWPDHVTSALQGQPQVRLPPVKDKTIERVAQTVFGLGASGTRGIARSVNQ
jgi:hypothetical protein